MISIIITIASLSLNAALLWYVSRILRKLLFISENLGDLYFTFRSFSVFVKSLYGMNSFHGEPIIQELVQRVGEVLDEIEMFREIFEYTLDEELEEELNEVEQYEENTPQAV
jgi:hypothetical protein|tara:strand:+ start:1455 stop:1790 length:336 start_codon:yes stop_codon:yes gene_type:complete